MPGRLDAVHDGPVNAEQVNAWEKGQSNAPLERQNPFQ
jgi:hypothetical protein